MKLKCTKGYAVTYYLRDENKRAKWSDGFNIYPNKELANEYAEKDFEADTHASTKGWELETWFVYDVKIWKEEQE